MNTQKHMTWLEFKTQLEQHPDLSLQFQYASGKWVKPSYHITEIKQAPLVSVDCGGQMNSWTEVILQLWEPGQIEKGREEAMQVHKALSIIKLVEKSLALHPAAWVKIEFGNVDFDTRQMNPQQFTTEGQNLVVNLNPGYTQCKAINRAGSCGPEENDCCTADHEIQNDQTEQNETLQASPAFQKIEMFKAEDEAPSCVPGSGCCS